LHTVSDYDMIDHVKLIAKINAVFNQCIGVKKMANMKKVDCYNQLMAVCPNPDCDTALEIEPYADTHQCHLCETEFAYDTTEATT
jgi:hypothetical protein